MKKKLQYIILFITVFLAYHQSYAQKTDSIFHINGNILTGELKKMNYGVATWKMDGMGTINFELVNAKAIISNKQFEIKTKNGAIYFGKLVDSNIYREMKVITETGEVIISIDDIVELYPIKGNFWMRTSGNLSLGFNYSKGSDIAAFDIAGNLSYRKEKSYFDVSWNTNNTYKADSLNSVKADVNLLWQRMIVEKWSYMAIISGSQNTELGIRWRMDVSSLGIKDFIYNDWNRVYGGLGLNASHETPFGGAEIRQDLAGLFRLGWKVYKYTDPKLWIDADISYLPYITESGRSRVVANLNPQVSVFNNNFKIGLKLYYAYDSKPPETAISDSDYGINLQLTYSLH